jgi:5-methylcytosine-specific restriction endonuclease McrA
VSRRRFDYGLYLRSEAWAEVRRKITKRYKGRCAICGGPGGETHHVTYKHVGHERLYELLWLCTRCHAAWHQRLGQEAVRVE